MIPESPLAPDLIDDSLLRSQRENAVFMNWVRFALATGFALVYALAILVLKDDSFRATTTHLALYWVISAALATCGGRFRLTVGLSRFAVPLIDLARARV